MTNSIEPDIICLELTGTTKQEIFIELVELLDKTGKLTNKQDFLKDIWLREEIGNTGFEDGIAIPHAKSKAVISPAVIIGVSKLGIDYGVDDGQLSHVFFLLASPDTDEHNHIENLVQISSKILEDGFIQRLKKSQTIEQARALFCVENTVDKINLFSNNNENIKSANQWAKQAISIKKHLLFGTSHMIQFIVAGGVLLSLSMMFSGNSIIPEHGVLADIAKMGEAGLSLFTLVLGGYIAYSIADKPGLAPGMIGTWIAVNQYQTGFLGAIIVGFWAGFVVCQLKKIKLTDEMGALGSIFIYPIMGTFLTCATIMWLIGTPLANAMLWFDLFLTSIADSGRIMLATVLGAMTAFDMGGPINKTATLFAQTQVDTHPWLMGGVGIAICTPPLGMALATFFSPKKFKAEEREAGKAASIMGMIGISEGAIPFAVADPARVLPSIIIGSILGNIIGFSFEVLNHAPWGGWIVLPVVEGRIGYILGTLIGALTTALMVIILKKNVLEDDNSSVILSHCIPKEGHADILAVTSCPSGVAHTFLAAKSLEQTAAQLGIKIKVETQGANGIINRITAQDVKNAKMVIFANDVAMINPERFNDIKIIETSTQDAIYNSVSLLTKQ